MDFSDFKKEYLEDIHLNAQIDGTMPDDCFFSDMLERLSNMGELVDPQIRYVQKKCRSNKIMAFDGYCFDDSDKSLILIMNEYSDFEGENLTKQNIEQDKTRMLNFVREAYDAKLGNYFDFTDDVIRIGENIGKRLRKDYVDKEEDSIDKIKLYIVTNKDLSDRIKSLTVDDFEGKRVETNIWNLDRLYEVIKSGKDRETIVIDVKKYQSKGIPCIKANMSDNLDYDAYLAIVPGQLLNDIYYEYGSRLLEGNVRAFLSNRGKINRGIRDTIRKEPTKFFTYNNGIACTASNIDLSEDGLMIEKIEDLQIINGGQTTASLASAKLKDKASLDNIFVPMKMTVVKNDDYDSMIANISKYANSQNKVTDADLFSNHPFHRTFEQLAKKITAPMKAGGINNTFWYYERSRGKYEQEQFKLTTKKAKEDFLRKYPKKQVIKKEELAKYYTAAELKRPDIVSKGSANCMNYFANYIDDKFQNEPETFNEVFYQRCVCDSIVYRSTEIIVKNASWYQVGGYRLNIVPYTISKLMSLIPTGYCIDYERIWKKQELYPSLNYEIEKIAKMTDEYIRNTSIIVTEYCKKEETWKNYKKIDYKLSDSFIEDLASLKVQSDKMESAKKEEKLVKNLNLEVEIFQLGGAYWRRLIAEGKQRRLLTPKEVSLLEIAASSDSPRPKFATESQAKLIWQIRNKLEDNGIIVD